TSPSFDSQLTLFQPDGSTVMASNDGSIGNGGDSGIETQARASFLLQSVDNAGTYFLRVKQLDDTQDISAYRLFVNVIPPNTFPPEQEDIDNFDQANPLTQNTPLLGVVKSSIPDFYKFDAFAGDKVWVQTVGEDTEDTQRTFSFDIPTTGTYFV